MDGWEGGEPPGKRRPVVVVGSVLLGVVILASLVRSDSAGTSEDDADPGTLEVDPSASPSPADRRGSSAPSGPAPLEGEVGAWTPLPDAPIAGRDEPVAVWTGRELLLWGGVSDPQDASGLHRRTLHGDGAAYDPAARSWRPLADSPLDARQGAAAAWTGTELVLVGGFNDYGALADAAAYDPASDTWRALPAPPLSPRAYAAAAWTGAEVLVQGGNDLLGPLADGAAYNPATDSWQPLPPGPFPIGGTGLDMAPARSGVVAAGLEIDRSGVVAAEYGRDSRQWSPLPELPTGRRQVLGLVDAGDAVLGLTPVLQSGCCAELVELRDDATAWEVQSSSPLAASSAVAAVWSGTGYLIPPDGAAPGAYWDAATGAWSIVPGVLGLEEEDATATWAGDRLLLWGANDSDGPDGLELRLRPPP